MNEGSYDQYRDALRIGYLAVLRGANDRAIEAFHEAATVQPERAAPHVALGRAYLATGRPGDALRAFVAALNRAPDDASALDGAVGALLELDRDDEAADLLDRLATIHQENGRVADALASIERAVEIAGSAWRRLMLERLGGRLPRASGTVLTWLPSLPASPVGTAPRMARDLAPEPVTVDLRAIAESVEAARRGDDVQALVAGARALARVDRLQAAAVACNDALSIAPADPDVHRTLAAIYRRRGWARAAQRKVRIVERYQRVVDDPDALDREAESALVTGDLDELLRVVQQHADNGRAAAALDLLFSALAVAPGDPRLYLAIARLHLARGRRDRAVKEVDRLVRLADAAGDTEARQTIAAFVNDMLRPGVGKAAPAD